MWFYDSVFFYSSWNCFANCRNDEFGIIFRDGIKRYFHSLYPLALPQRGGNFAILDTTLFLCDNIRFLQLVDNLPCILSVGRFAVPKAGRIPDDQIFQLVAVDVFCLLVQSYPTSATRILNRELMVLLFPLPVGPVTSRFTCLSSICLSSSSRR